MMIRWFRTRQLHRSTSVRSGLPRPSRRYQLQFECLEERRLLANGAGYVAINLVSDQPGVAQIQDPNLVNAWGIAVGVGGGNFWVSDNETGVTTVYRGAVNGSPFEQTPRSPTDPAPLVVTIPEGKATGQVFNPFFQSNPGDFVVSDGAGHSGPAIFIFASEAGLITGWNPAVPPPPPSSQAQVGFTAVDGAAYKGLAIAGNTDGRFLYAADFTNGKIDVFDSSFQPVQLAGDFTDPHLPEDYAPFNIQSLGGKLYVTFALRGDELEDGVPEEEKGPGLGIVDVFSKKGKFEQRLVSFGPLNAPWGLALAPHDFGKFKDALLVGNFGDGLINAFNPRSGKFLGTLSDTRGHPLVIPGLWGLQFGNGVTAGDSNALFFTAGPDDEEHGLLGMLRTADSVKKQITRDPSLHLHQEPGEGDFAAIFNGFLTLTNATGNTLEGTFVITISNLPGGVTLVSAAGKAPDHTPTGDPVINLGEVSLVGHQSLSIALSFGSTSGAPFDGSGLEFTFDLTGALPEAPEES